MSFFSLRRFELRVSMQSRVNITVMLHFYIIMYNAAVPVFHTYDI